MTRYFTIVGISLAIVVAIAMFQVKDRVVGLEEHLAAVHKEIFLAEESIHLLRSEWAYLNAPQRLQELSSQHLKMVASDLTQMISLDHFLDEYQEEYISANLQG